MLIILKITCYCVSLTCFVIGTYFGIWWIKKLGWKRCQGEIISLDISLEYESITYFPVIEYELDGRRITFKNEFGSFPKGVIGKTVCVLIDPKNGKDCIFSIRQVSISIMAPWMIAVLFLLLGKNSI